MSTPRVYTTRFIGANVNGPDTASYTVPDGYRAVVRDLSGQLINADNKVNQQLTAYIETTGGAVPIFFADEFPPFMSGETHWEGRVVAYQGEAIVVDCNTPGAEWSVTVTGYLFLDPGA